MEVGTKVMHSDKAHKTLIAELSGKLVHVYNYLRGIAHLSYY